MLPKNLFTTLAAATNFQKGITNGVAGVAGVNVAAKAFDDAERASIDDQKVFSDFEKAMAKMKWVELPSNILKILKTSQEVYFVPLSHKAAASAAETAENAEEFFKNFDWSKSGPEIAEAIKNNPKLVIPVGAAAGATVGFLVVGPALGVAGFSSIGPVAGKTDPVIHYDMGGFSFLCQGLSLLPGSLLERPGLSLVQSKVQRWAVTV